MVFQVFGSACIARQQPAQLLRAGAGIGRRAAVAARHQRQHLAAALPAAASEVFTDAVQAVPDVMAGPPSAALDTMAGPPPAALDVMAGPPAAAAMPAAADALAAAQAAAESDPTDFVFTALFTIASEQGHRWQQYTNCAALLQCECRSKQRCEGRQPARRAAACADLPVSPVLHSRRAQRGHPGRGVPVVHLLERQPHRGRRPRAL